MYTTTSRLTLAALAAVLVLATPPLSPAGFARQDATAEAALRGARPVIWQRPSHVRQFDFVYGPWGRERAPLPPFTFVEEDMTGTTPKVKVRDARGTKWTVKFGEEARPEAFAYRMVSAVGYFVEPCFIVKS